MLEAQKPRRIAPEDCLAFLVAQIELVNARDHHLEVADLVGVVAPRQDLAGSGEVDRNLWQNLDLLSTDDQIKFVICSRADFEWAGEQVRQRQLDGICTVWFSPSYEQIKPVDIADWILQERLPVRLQLQLHKYLWGTGPGH